MDKENLLSEEELKEDLISRDEIDFINYGFKCAKRGEDLRKIAGEVVQKYGLSAYDEFTSGVAMFSEAAAKMLQDYRPTDKELKGRATKVS